MFYFANQNVISGNDISIYAYGFEMLFSEIINTLIIIFIAVVTNHFLEAIIYMTVFTFMRESAGGYHAKTHRNCILIFTSVFIGFVLLLEILPYNLYNLIISIGLTTSLLLIWKYAPIDDPNKPFTSNEKEKFRIRSLVLNFCFTIICILSLIFHFYIKLIGLCVMLGLLTVGISVRAAYVNR